jgi:two-component system OmpR family response regulator
VDVSKTNGEKVLIVDDEIDICYLLSGILRQKKLRTSYVNNLADAQSVLKEEIPSIVFLDNNLPDGKGIDFISKIKQLYPATKVVMITAFDTYSDRSKAYEQGVDFFIGKPFTRDVIDKTLERLMYSNLAKNQA